MKARLAYSTSLTLLVAGWIFSFGGCSSAKIMPPQAPDAIPPSLDPPPISSVPHPIGMDLGDVRAIFFDQKAPARETLKDCDTRIAKLKELAKSEEEFKRGVKELIQSDPVQYHWCFYGKLLELDERIKAATYVDEKQKAALEIYSFLVPVARGFLAEFKDSRYLRWAISHYRKMSEWVFYRRLDLSPQETSELVEAAHDTATWREPAVADSVLEKYKISVPKKEKPPVAPPSDAMEPPPATTMEKFGAVIDENANPLAEPATAPPPAVSP